MKKTHPCWFFLPYLIAMIFLFIGAFYDYAITDALHGMWPLLGRSFERIVLIPVQMMIPVTFCIFYVVHQKRWSLVAGMLAFGYVLHDALRYWIPLHSYFALLLISAAAILGVVIILKVLHCFSLETLRKGCLSLSSLRACCYVRRCVRRF